MSERQKGLRFMETAARAVFSLRVIFPVAAWTALALWNRAPGDLWVRSIGACAIGLVAAIAIAELMLRRRARALPAFGFAFCGVAIWFSAIPAPREGDWAREVARQPRDISTAKFLLSPMSAHSTGIAPMPSMNRGARGPTTFQA
jgi:hypothetical protein